MNQNEYEEISKEISRQVKSGDVVFISIPWKYYNNNLTHYIERCIFPKYKGKSAVAFRVLKRTYDPDSKFKGLFSLSLISPTKEFWREVRSAIKTDPDILYERMKNHEPV